MQKEEEQQWKEELENIAAEPFARSVDDTRLEEARKAEIRPDDPMAAYMAKVSWRGSRGDVRKPQTAKARNAKTRTAECGPQKRVS